jgi:hypothetical protein
MNKVILVAEVYGTQKLEHHFLCQRFRTPLWKPVNIVLLLLVLLQIQ